MIGDAISPYMVSYSEVPGEYELGLAYPNPFNPSTNIEFSLAEDGLTSVSIYDLQGRFVTELVHGFMQAGNYNVQWNATDQSSGVYFIRMDVNGFSQMQKVMLIK